MSTWLLSPLDCLSVVALAAVLAALLAQLAIRGGPVDIPRERGAHKAPTPTSGGLAVMAASGLVIALCTLLFVPEGARSGLWLFGFAALAGLSGAIDDVLDLPAKARLLFQIILCAGFASLYPVHELILAPGLTLAVPFPLGVLAATAWLVLGLNAINFMDGSNGLAIGTQAVCLLIYAAFVLAFGSQPMSMLGGVLLVFLATGGAFAGLLPFNLPLNRVFQGDAGSLFGGALVTGGALVLSTQQIASIWLGGFLLAPLLVDVLLTLVWRAQRKRNLFEAHKDHLYQQWLIHRDPDHGRLALKIWGLCALSCAIGTGARLIGITTGVELRFAALCLVVAALCYGWFRIRRGLTG
ncbi:glycosyl transferase family 4 family protein [Asticcacaulis sp.]|uniref:glycosyltransferase family 4 protein n=1 Tax=Asticcacaulis sp. TaxID=1872648 RepID=UPI00260202A4|nr:glycosyl transferase family 4 family protein [Asticcacaulis sp.]